MIRFGFFAALCELCRLAELVARWRATLLCCVVLCKTVLLKLVGCFGDAAAAAAPRSRVGECEKFRFCSLSFRFVLFCFCKPILALAASSPQRWCRSGLKDERVAIQLAVVSVLSYELSLFSVLAGRSVLADLAQCYACWTTERFVLRRGRPGSAGPSVER